MPTKDSLTLGDFPDLGYLFNEFYRAYRYRSAGGSARVRTHMSLVRGRISKAVTGYPTVVLPASEQKPVCAHLDRALDNGERDVMASMVKAVENVRHLLCWNYGYNSMPKGLEKKYAYAELLGPSGPVISEILTLGLVLFAPRTTYPAHAHTGITESYLVLSGATSENDLGVYVPGSMILNLPGHEHAITTSDYEPVLLAYAWVGEPRDLAAQEMVFTKPPRRRNPL
jgi:dimethylpropiothetin dethiomethylase